MSGRETRRPFTPWLLLLLLAAVAPLLVLGAQGSEEPAEAVAQEAPEAGAEPEMPEELRYRKWETTAPGTYGDYNRRTNLVQRGRRVYDMYCVGCHGVYGDGNGPAAKRLLTQPRDFTSGIYKFRSTDSSSLPLEADLYRTISRGLSRVSMPAFPLMPEREKIAVIEYIKTFYPRWDDEKDGRTVVPVPRAPADLEDPQRISRGRVVYIDMQCGQCHGYDGQGTGATRTEYVDAWGNQQRPFNFTRGSLKGGDSPEDIYRTFHTGLQSIMPSYGGTTLAAVTVATFRDKSDRIDPGELAALESVFPEFPKDGAALGALDERESEELALRNSWDLVAYIESLRQRTTTAAAVLGAPPTSDEGETAP